VKTHDVQQAVLDAEPRSAEEEAELDRAEEKGRQGGKRFMP